MRGDEYTWNPWLAVWRHSNPVRRARSKRRMSVVELSRRSSVHLATLKTCERGRQRTGAMNLAKLAAALRVPVEQMLHAYLIWWECRP